MSFPAVTMFVSRDLPRFMSPGLVARNSISPQATTWQQIGARLNHALHWRRKQLFFYPAQTTWLTKGGAARERWRFRFRTGTHAAKLGVRMQIAQLDGVGTDPYVKFVCTAVGGGTSPSFEMHAGGGSATSSDVTSESTFAYMSEACDADKEYTVEATEYGSARLISACFFEEASFAVTSGGYPPERYSVGSPIYDADRQAQLEAATNAWKKNGSHLFSYAVNQYTAPRTTSVGTTRNPVDDSLSTSASVASPGFWADLEYCNTIGQAQVPVEFSVYASCSAGNGLAHLLDSATATTLISISNITTEGWYTATGTIPATLAKYDMAFKRGNNPSTTSLWSFTLAQYLA